MIRLPTPEEAFDYKRDFHRFLSILNDLPEGEPIAESSFEKLVDEDEDEDLEDVYDVDPIKTINLVFKLTTDLQKWLIEQKIRSSGEIGEIARIIDAYNESLEKLKNASMYPFTDRKIVEKELPKLIELLEKIG